MGYDAKRPINLYNRTPAVVKRDEKGRLLPGQSLNPGGRPKSPITLLQEIGFDARRIFEVAIEMLEGGPIDPETGAKQLIYSSADRRWSAEFLRDTIYGKPTQSVAMAVSAGDAPQGPQAVDLDALTDAELEAYLAAEAAAQRVLVASAAMKAAIDVASGPERAIEGAEDPDDATGR